MTIISRDWKGLLVGQMMDNGYINITQLAKAYQQATGKYKKTSHWLENGRTKESIKYLSEQIKIPSTALVVRVSGGVPENQGTWVHPKLVVNFATWLSVELEYVVFGWVEDWLLKGKQPETTKVYLTGKEFADECIADRPVTVAPKYSRDFAREANRVWHGKESDRFQGLQHFINKFIYDRYPWEARFKIDLNRVTHKYKHTKHSYFRDGIPTDLLEDALGKITCLLEQCETGDRATFYKVYCAAMTDDNFWKVEKEAIEKVS